jgi:UDP-N-acetylmuramyl tripeptide synthase
LEENLEKAVQIALELTPAEETLHIIPTYTAMLEVRGILTGRKIL